ncbi:MAG: S8 family serine peptidase [Halopenitus sp.]
MASTNNPTGERDGLLTRRALLQALGIAAGGSLLGAGSADLASAASTDAWDEYRDWRANEANKVWDRGYRGQSDRTIGLTDSGIDARHPEVGPWNGVRAYIEDGELKLTKPEQNDVSRSESGETESFSGTLDPSILSTGEETYHEFTTPTDVDELDATLSYSPHDSTNDLEFRIDIWTGDRWETEALSATDSEPETLSLSVEDATDYRFVIEAYIDSTTDYQIDGTYYDVTGITTVSDSEVFEGTGGDPTADTPKTVGWYNESPRYGDYKKPRDPNGHGTHVSSIMSGTGRASAIDGAAFSSAQPETYLSDVSGQTLTYDVAADAGTGLFGAAYGDLIELRLYDPNGNQIDSSGVGIDDSSTGDVNIVEEPATVTGTYTYEIRTADGEDASSAYVDRVGYGPYLDPDTTAGDRDTGTPDGTHSGLAPHQSIIGLQGLSAPTEDLGRYASQFVDTFNLRAVNMSWGYVGGLPLGAAAGTLGRIPGVIKDIAQAGVLTLAAAGNSATPVNGNGAPAVADEAVSVVATGPRDGIAGYSSGGIGGVDEDEEDTYMKPDLTAPGGTVSDLISAAEIGDPDTAESDQPPIRDYTGKAGTSMAAPFTTGSTGLVAQAMEEDGGPRLSLPAPTNTALDDVFRLKQVLLATSSETVFTAAPYHRAKTPTYDFGGRDPYEGFGRLNPEVAVDAVTRELAGTTSEQVGLGIPQDSRAVAGYVDLGVGELEASVDFTGYEGSDTDLTTGDPHIDLFVYDGGNPEDHGEPNVVDRGAGPTGSASVSAAEKRGGGGSTYLVVAKLVDVPGAVNGDDVQVNFDLTVDKTAGVRANGGRPSEDDSLLGAGVLDTVEVTVTPDADVAVRDIVPEEFDVVSDVLNVVTDTDAGVKYVELGDAAADQQTSFTYDVEAPTSLLDFSKEHLFGPFQVDDGSGWTGVSGTVGTKHVKGD